MELDSIKDFFTRRDRLARLLGIELREVGVGRATAAMPVEDHHMNGGDVVHGAALFALADLAFAAASNSHGVLALAVSATMSYVRPGLTGTLKAEAREVSRGNKLATYVVDVTDEQGEVLAVFQGTVYRKRQRLEELEASS